MFLFIYELLNTQYHVENKNTRNDLLCSELTCTKFRFKRNVTSIYNLCEPKHDLNLDYKPKNCEFCLSLVIPQLTFVLLNIRNTMIKHCKH